jgi:hypothetical protein
MMAMPDWTKLRKAAAWGLWCASLVGVVITLAVCIWAPLVPGVERRLLLIGWGLSALYALAGWLSYSGIPFGLKAARPD